MDIVPVDGGDWLAMMASYLGGKALSPPAAELGKAFSEHVAVWRWKRQVRLAEEVRRIRADKPGASRIPPPEFLLPSLEAATDAEEGEELHEMWAHLIASGFTDGELPRAAYRETLRQLSALDARLLVETARGLRYKRERQNVPQGNTKFTYHPTKSGLALLERLGTDQDGLYLSLENLFNLQVVRPSRYPSTTNSGRFYFTITARFTAWGNRLMKCCAPELAALIKQPARYNWIESNDLEEDVWDAKRAASSAERTANKAGRKVAAVSQKVDAFPEIKVVDF